MTSSDADAQIDKKSDDSDLYARCFMNDGKQDQNKLLSPKDVFARVLKQIEQYDFELLIRPPFNRLEKQQQRGYVFAVREVDSNYVFMAFGGNTSLKSAMARLQSGNPRQLQVIGLLQRDHIDDARLICEHMHRGMTMWRVRGMWYEMDDYKKVSAMFSRVDRLDSA